MIDYFQDTQGLCDDWLFSGPLFPDFILFSQTAVHFPTFTSCTETDFSPWLFPMLKFAPLGSRLMERCRKDSSLCTGHYIDPIHGALSANWETNLPAFFYDLYF